MAQFDIHRDLGRNSLVIPFLLNVQTSRLNHLKSRLVLPVGPTLPGDPIAIRVQVLERVFALQPHDMFAAPLRVLGEAVQNLSDDTAQIIAAIDAIITTAYS